MTNLKKIMFFALFLSAFVLYSTSCNKSDEILEDATEVVTEQSTHFKVSEHGWLYFEDEAALDAAKEEIFQMINNLDEWEAKYGYKSLRTAYTETMDMLTEGEMMAMGTRGEVFDKYKDVFTFIGEGEDREAVCIIENDLLATLLNHQGVYQIGEEIHKHHYDVVKIIKDGDVSKLSIISQMNAGDESSNIEIRHHQENYRISADEELSMRASCYGFGSETANSPRKKARRIQGKLNIYNSGAFVYINIKATKQRKFGAWYNNNWNGWVSAESWNLRSWRPPYTPGSNDLYYAPGQEYTGDLWGELDATAYDGSEYLGLLQANGSDNSMHIDYDLTFRGYWTGAGGRSYKSDYKNDLHLLECYE